MGREADLLAEAQDAARAGHVLGEYVTESTRAGYARVLKFCLAHGAEASEAALEIAYINLDVDCATVLLEAGADPDCGFPVRARHHPFFVLAERHVCDGGARRAETIAMVRAMMGDGLYPNVHALGADGATVFFALTRAALHEALEALADAGADTERGHADAPTPLFYATDCFGLRASRAQVDSSDDDKLDTVRTLVRLGVKLEPPAPARAAAAPALDPSGAIGLFGRAPPTPEAHLRHHATTVAVDVEALRPQLTHALLGLANLIRFLVDNGADDGRDRWRRKVARRDLIALFEEADPARRVISTDYRNYTPVVIDGLRKATDLNGANATVVGQEATFPYRYHVAVDAAGDFAALRGARTRKVAIKWTNLRRRR